MRLRRKPQENDRCHRRAAISTDRQAAKRREITGRGKRSRNAASAAPVFMRHHFPSPVGAAEWRFLPPLRGLQSLFSCLPWVSLAPLGLAHPRLYSSAASPLDARAMWPPRELPPGISPLSPSNQARCHVPAAEPQGNALACPHVMRLRRKPQGNGHCHRRAAISTERQAP